ncbi:MAG: hypothetical protein EOM85_02335 [Candidatus Moranbacteria bacterium]|nr:hypothetical protein [Candidatus Moranbacteria bacterium]
MKKVIPFVLAALLMVLAISCEKEPIPPAPLPTFSVNINKIGNGSATADKTTGITAGSTVNFKFTPDSGYSLYSIKVNDKSINAIIPFGSEYTYSYFGVNSNIKMDVVFVETYNLIISAIIPWKLKAMDIYRENGDFYFSFPLSPEDKEIKRYFYYPQGEVKMYYSDGSLYWSATWSISGNKFKLGDGDMTIIELTASRLVFKASPVKGGDGTYTYAQYTYERS